MTDAIHKFAKFVIETRFEDIPEDARAATKKFILDCFGVGMIGSSGPWVTELIKTQSLWGQGNDARIWNSGDRVPTPTAAMCNAYQIHNSEFDCVHEGAVAHAMTAVLPCVLAEAERRGGMTGQELITTVAIGVDVACNLGLAAKTGLRFFRPGTVGLFAGVAGISILRGFDQETLTRAFSIGYAQLSGTMQPHTEGSMLLGMQIGFNARNAVVACDMAEAGLAGLQGVLEGPFGYFSLIELEYDLADILANIGKIWRVTEMAHKPFPSGRATHGVADAALLLQKEHNLTADQIESATLTMPSLTKHLVGRPAHDAMDVNYARLCSPYVAAVAFMKGEINIPDFHEKAFRDPVTVELAKRISVEANDNPDPNALSPVEVSVTLKNGTVLRQGVEIVYGNPENAMTRDAWLEKFHKNAAGAAKPISREKADAMVDLVDHLEDLDDVRILVDNLVAG
ncbi:MAG: MmgE/PrpD family protein [Alphaproteobacteria bacterium]|jgi:aconitate decarboxylase|nr:MmgE/PrpD family protein [Alphaproteobacteria bacterium]MBT4017516.1 MmgE/PrpD family protein [Alphaproteobacteria bacterium]MBT4964671.1 MmgE/PrpD family protein [Alphaproteobacteria bacterium]MBT5161122.1 MmgE/PrpD family protein [Alphaproteobacteria bacterium]